MNFREHFQNVCNNLAEIYALLHNKGIDTDKLDKATSELYNVLNKLEKEFKE